MPSTPTATTFLVLACIVTPATAQDDDPTQRELVTGDEPAEPSAPPRANKADLRRNYLDNLVEQDTITGDWWGHGDELLDMGITLTLDLWVSYQATVAGGVTSAEGSTGEYRLASHFDLERLAGIDGGGVFLRIDGGWDDGPDSSTVGTLLAPDGEFARDSVAILTHLWYEQEWFDARLRFRVGVQDIADGMDFHGHTVAFDGNAYANFGGAQFLNGGLVNNGTIPFPDPGLAAMVFGEPVDHVYGAAALTNVTDELGVVEAFDLTPEWMALLEAGIVDPFDSDDLPGAYSVGYWRLSIRNGPSSWGVYVDMDQMLYREDPGGLQGLGMFARYGYASDSPTLIRDFFSIGAQYRGPFPTRDNDIIALGWAQAFPIAAPPYTEPFEGVIEGYYRAVVTPWFSISPMIQYIVNPGAVDAADAVLVGLRTQFVF